MDFTLPQMSVLGQHYVRIGILGSVGRFAATGRERYPRGTRVICRTQRGLEIGEILSAAETEDIQPPDGELLRCVTVEDNLLIARLEKNRSEAFLACSARLVERGSSAMLVDVEHLFDGRAIYFYFLGETTPDLDNLTSELAEVYEAKAQLEKFAETLVAGCGPNCGTEEGGGCGTGGCSTCSVLSACGTKHRH